MRNSSRVVLARHASAQLEQASCGGQGGFWNDHEQLYAAATSRRAAAAAAAAAPALELCERCPVLELCAVWASTDQYTGLAAGHTWADGRHRSADIGAGAVSDAA